MKLNNKWGYGQLFGFSAIEGPNRYYDDNILMTMQRKFEFRFEYRPYYIKFNFPTLSPIKVKAIMSDFAIGECKEGKILLTFLDNDTLVGVSPVLPEFKGEKKLIHEMDRNIHLYRLDRHYLGFLYEKRSDGLYKFIIHHSFTQTESRAECNFLFDKFDIDELINQRISYYKKLPKCVDKKYEKLYYKCLSVNKVNVNSPCGQIPTRWTTPDRVPHRHMWLWDSAFHALSFSTYNMPLAEEILLAMLKRMRSDGFMPHMTNPTDSSDVTQPCVLSWAVYKLYEKSHNVNFLKEAVYYLDKYLTYDLNNRDKNHNGLLEWKTEPEYELCKCGESGLDNSPRFDFDVEMDVIDFSCYFALDSHYLSEIYKVLGNLEASNKWEEISKKTASKINELLYEKESGLYFDRLFTGELTRVLTHSSFLPLFSEVASKEQASRLIKHIFDETELYTKAPIASISQKDPRFSTDMWRGGVWINLNYFVIHGLKKYGYIKEAEELRTKTLEMINKWFKLTGCVFEFYDPNNEISPFYLERKGKPLKKPDYRKHVHSITDFNWSACFALLLIQGEY